MCDKKPLILIADDNSENLQFLGNLLIKNGYDTGVAQDGLVALEFVENEKPDLVLLDIMMPKMDGYKVCEKLKAGKVTKHIPVIFLTAKTEIEDISKGFEVGGVDYLTKPFNTIELLARVKTHIEIKILKGFLPICCHCKKIRDDDGFWEELETYLLKYADTSLSHGICPDCLEKHYPQFFPKK